MRSSCATGSPSCCSVGGRGSAPVRAVGGQGEVCDRCERARRAADEGGLREAGARGKGKCLRLVGRSGAGVSGSRGARRAARRSAAARAGAAVRRARPAAARLGRAARRGGVGGAPHKRRCDSPPPVVSKGRLVSRQGRRAVWSLMRLQLGTRLGRHSGRVEGWGRGKAGRWQKGSVNSAHFSAAERRLEAGLPGAVAAV